MGWGRHYLMKFWWMLATGVDKAVVVNFVVGFRRRWGVMEGVGKRK